MRLNPNLLDSPHNINEIPAELNACLNAHGLYNSVQFVLRLSPEIHRKLEAVPKGIIEGDIDLESLQAYSTYLHETIHWWQHIGSTTGLMLSLSYPGQAHANYTHLKNLISRIGPKKSIRRFTEICSECGDPETAGGLANIVVNNHFDIEFFRILITNPTMTRQVVEHPLFENVGHSYRITYGNIVLVLAATFDNNHIVLPDPREWSNEFAKLRSRKKKGYYYGSDVSMMPLGALQIFEGQARFIQLQYLFFCSDGKLQWEEVRSMGMLKGVYGEAFEQFLRLAELEWPSSIDDPVVALFLLVCDLAINPGRGFPMPLWSFETFIEDVDPGFRFVFICRTIATKRPDVAGIIRNYSRNEYVEVSEALCCPLILDTPLAIAERVYNWTRISGDLKVLMQEHKSFGYGPVNLPVRLLFAHFLAFCEDKFAKPEFFCWPGAWMAGKRLSSEIPQLFDRHSAPFLDKPDDEGIYPRLMSDKEETVVQESFDSFYAVNLTYDLTRQWIARAGPFEYDYRWLSSTTALDIVKDFANRHFEQIYSVHPDRFELI